MKNSKCGSIAAIVLLTVAFSAMAEEAQGQSPNRGVRPAPYRGRVGIAPLPSPMPRPGNRRVGVEPLPSPSPRLLVDVLIDMHADAVWRGDLRVADMLEELIIINPTFIIDPIYIIDPAH